MDKIPGEHMGPDAWNLEEQGIETKKGDRNRKIDHDNALVEVTKHYVLPDTVAGDSVVDLGAEPVPGDIPLIAAAHDERAGADSTASEPPDTATVGSDEPLSDAQLQEIYRTHLRHSVAGMVRQSMQGATEQVVRLRDYARAVLEKTKALAHGVFDRYAARFMQQPPRDQDRER